LADGRRTPLAKALMRPSVVEETAEVVEELLQVVLVVDENVVETLLAGRAATTSSPAGSEEQARSSSPSSRDEARSRRGDGLPDRPRRAKLAPDTGWLVDGGVTLQSRFHRTRAA
jgi:hypothetical protein